MLSEMAVWRRKDSGCPAAGIEGEVYGDPESQEEIEENSIEYDMTQEA